MATATAIAISIWVMKLSLMSWLVPPVLSVAPDGRPMPLRLLVGAGGRALRVRHGDLTGDRHLLNAVHTVDGGRSERARDVATSCSRVPGPRGRFGTRVGRHG